MRLKAILCAAALLVANPALAESYTNPTIGLTIEKPESWHVLTAAENAQNLARAEFSSAEFQEAIRKYATAPLYAFMKFPEPFDDVNPSVKVNVRPAGALSGKPGTEVLKVILPTLEAAMPGYRLVSGPEEVTLNGRKAGHATIHYELKSGGQTFPASSEMWIIPRGDHLFILGAGYRQDEKTGSREELMQIVRSLQIAD